MEKEKVKDEKNSIHLSVYRTSPRLEKVKLLDGGRQGAILVYNNCLSVNGVGSNDHHTTQRKIPVPKSLRIMFDEMREYLLDCFSYIYGSDTAKELLLSKSHCFMVNYNQSIDKFSLGGFISHSSGVRANLNGPLMALSGYEYESELREIIKKLFKEAELYLTGMKVADKKQIVSDYLQLKKGIENGEEEFENMSKEDQERFINEASEMYGLQVVEENGEMVIATHDHENDLVAKEVKKRLVEEVIKSSNKEEEIINDIDAIGGDDDFDIPMFNE